VSFSRRRVVKYIVRALLGSLALILITSVLLVCRLLISPMQLDTLSPAIQRALSGLPGNHAVRMEGVELAWDRATHVLQLRATQVALVDHSGDRIVAAPAVNISISVNALTSGVVALSSIKLEGAKIHLLRSKDGTLQLGTKVHKGTAGAARPHKTGDFHDLTEVIAGAFASLESAPNPQHPLSYLEAIDLQGDFTIEDQKLDMEFLFHDINFSFRGKENGVAGDLSLSVASPQALSGVDLNVSLLARGADITVNIKASGVEPARLAGLNDRLKALEGVDLSLDATVVGAVTLPDTVKSLDLNIVGGAGSISLDQFFAEPLSIRSLKLKAQLDPAARHVDLDYLDMSLGKDDSAGPSLNVSGSAHSVDGTTTLDMVTAIEHFQVEDLATYWPAGMVPGARA
jgi:hypothetical protein